MVGAEVSNVNSEAEKLIPYACTFIPSIIFKLP